MLSVASLNFSKLSPYRELPKLKRNKHDAQYFKNAALVDICESVTLQNQIQAV